MPLLDGNSDLPKKKLEFHCTNCGAEIITQYLRPGDTLICRFCRKETIIPTEAIETQEDSTAERILKKGSLPASNGPAEKNNINLKFNCACCGFKIIVHGVEAGNILSCPSCGSRIVVPSDAVQTHEQANLDFEEPPRHLPDQRYETSLAPSRFVKPEKPKEPTQWGIASVLKLVAAYILGLLVIGIVGGCIFTLLVNAIVPETSVNEELFDTVYLPKFFHALEVFDSILIVFLIYYSVVKRHHNNFFETLHLDKVPKSQLIRYLYLAAATIGAIWLIEVVVGLTPLKNYIPKDLPIDYYFQQGIGGIVWFSLMAIIAPITEELLFRGYMFAGFQHKLGTKWAAILVTVLFVSLHGPQLAFSPFHLLMISIAAIIFVIIRIRTNSLTKFIVYHFFYNLILTALIWGWIIMFGLESLKS